MSLGSIVVRLSMNTADFDTDAGRAAKIAQRRAKQIDDAFRTAGKAIGLALGAIAAGIVVAMKGAIDKMDETYNAAKKVGDSTENFSRLQYAAGLADVGMDQLVGTLGKLTKSQAAALDVTSDQAKVFKALGIEVTGANGAMRGSTEVMLDFADRFKEMKGSPEAMAAGFALFGRSFQDIIPLIESGSGEIRRLMEESDRLGITLTDSAGAAADKFKDGLDKLNGAVNGVWKEVANGMLPALDSASGRLTQLAADGDTARNIATLFSAALDAGVWALDAYNSAVGRTSIAIEAFIGFASNALQIQKNLMSLGFADGSIAGGFKGFAEVDRNKRAQLEKLIADGELSKAGMTRSQYNDRFAGQFNLGLPGSFSMAPAASGFNFADSRTGAQPTTADRNASLRLAMGANPSAAKKGKSGGKSDAEKMAEDAKRAADQAAEAQLRWNGTILDMEATLAGPLAKAQRAFIRETGELTAEYDKGNVSLSDYAKGLELYEQARDKEIKAINERKTPAEEMLADMQFEIELLGKTREQQELLTAARYLGAEAATAQGKAALAAMKENQDASKMMGDQIALMDQFRQGAANALTDFVTGAKSAKEALTDFFDSMAQMITQMIAEQWMAKMFGAQGSDGAGTGGGDILGSFFSMLFGGGKATGGWTGPGAMMQPAGIVHSNEVVWSQSDIARAGGVGAVEALRRGVSKSSGGGGGIVQNVYVQGRPDKSTLKQMERASGRGAAREMSRTGR